MKKKKKKFWTEGRERYLIELVKGTVTAGKK